VLDEAVPSPRSQVSPYEMTARVSESQPPPVAQSGVLVRDNAMTPASSVRSRSIERVPEGVCSNPASWSWTLLTPPHASGSMRNVAFAPAGDSAVAVATAGLLRWDRAQWSPLALPPQVVPGTLRGVRWMRDGSVLLF